MRYKIYNLLKYATFSAIIYSFVDFSKIAEILNYKEDLMKALSITISLSIICFILSVSIAYILAEFKNSNNKLLRYFAVAYESFGKLSIEVAIIKLFYALLLVLSAFKQQLFNEEYAFVPSPYYVAIIGISFVYSSYLIANFSQSMNDFKESIDLLRVYSISKFQTYYTFKVRMIFSKCKNAIKNNFLMVTKATGLASIFGVNELFAVTAQIGKSTHNLLLLNVLLLVCFYVLTSIVLKKGVK